MTTLNDLPQDFVSDYIRREIAESEFVIVANYPVPAAAAFAHVGQYEVRYFTADGTRIKTYHAPQDINHKNAGAFLHMPAYLKAHGWNTARPSDITQCVSLLSRANRPQWLKLGKES